MKKHLFILLLFAVSFSLNAQQMLVGSYNIRYKNWNDSVQGHQWPKRCQVICDQVNFMAPEIFGAQEVLYPQLQDMLKALDGYDYIGIGRDDGKQAGEHEAIFYKKDKLQLLDHGDFWLSETPDKPGLGWDAVCIRICTWGKFRMKSPEGHRGGLFRRGPRPDEKVFYFFNLHMDHVGVVARREAAKLVVAKVKEIAQGAPVFITGDFNVDQENEIYTIFTKSGILKDSYTAARIRFAENGTFNAFKTNYFTTSRIDHVFVSPDTQVEAYGVLTNSYWTPDEIDETLKSSDAPQEITFDNYIRRNPSDHYPVFVKIRF
ncbi:MAG: endonuclease/exonuclease/phosphatase family protein [Bacteroidales bacterium]|nr:endonuclease/exonuclease/phosphatase family protein [Bacteroidales bacterium]